MPSSLGPQFGGEWAIYTCSMYAAALANIAKIYPEERGKCLERMKRVVEIVASPEIRSYDTMAWKSDALETLDRNYGHMTYLSILAWVITNYKLIGGDESFDELLHSCCEVLNRRMLMRDDLWLSNHGNPEYLIVDDMDERQFLSKQAGSLITTTDRLGLTYEDVINIM